jgi:hypothetical protein
MPEGLHRRQPGTRGHGVDADLMMRHKWIGAHVKCVHLTFHCLDGGSDLRFASDIARDWIELELARHFLQGVHLQPDIGTGAIA